MLSLLTKIVGTKNDRELKRLRPYVSQIGELEPAVAKLTDAELRAKTDEFRARLERVAADFGGDVQVAKMIAFIRAGKRPLTMASKRRVADEDA